MEDDINQQTLTEDVLNDVISDTSKAEEIIESPSSDDTSYGEEDNNDVVKTSPEEDTASEDSHADVKDHSAQEKGKISWLEKQKNAKELEVKKANYKTYQTVLKMLSNENTKSFAEENLQNDPELYETFRVIHNEEVQKTGNGKLLPAYNQLYQSNSPISQGNNYQQPQSSQSVDPYALARQAADIMEKDKAVKSFIKKAPEMSFNSATDEYSYERLSRKWQTIEIVVNDLRADNPDMSYEEALNEAWNSLPQNRNKQIKQIEKVATMAGMAAANGSKVGVTSEVNSYKSSSKGSDELTAEDEEILKLLGATSKEHRETYIRYKQK